MSYTFELNNERKDANNVSGKVNAKSPVVEIFSAMAMVKICHVSAIRLTLLRNT